jgi:8-oxo-dGTP pyrophosphatase MutT (NUDIX family)
MEPRKILLAGDAGRAPLTRDFILRRFAARAEGGPPRLRGSGAAALAGGLRGDHFLTPGALAPAKPLTRAAVLVPLVEHPSGMTVLLTQRTSHLSAHAGQIAFPGGRIEPTDRDPVAGALREAEEEVGLPPSHVEVIGGLDTWITGTGYEIIPVVGLVRVPYPMIPDPSEVADVFEVPLHFIVDPLNHQSASRESNGVTRTFFVLPYENRYIWGATAGILINLAEVLVGEG